MEHDLACIYTVQRLHGHDTIKPLMILLESLWTFRDELESRHLHHYTALCLARITDSQIGDHLLHRDVVNLIREVRVRVRVRVRRSFITQRRCEPHTRG